MKPWYGCIGTHIISRSSSQGGGQIGTQQRTLDRKHGNGRPVFVGTTICKGVGWEAGILNGNGGKPKGMHWRTFEQLQALHDAQVNQSLAGMSAKLGLVMVRLGRIKN